MASMPEHDESAPPEPGDAVEHEGATTSADEATDDATDQRPLNRLAKRFRVPIGIAVAVIGVVVGVLIATEPRESSGAWAVVSHVAAVGIWACVTAVGVMWATSAGRRMMNLTALGGIACYVVTLATGL